MGTERERERDRVQAQVQTSPNDCLSSERELNCKLLASTSHHFMAQHLAAGELRSLAMKNRAGLSPELSPDVRVSRKPLPALICSLSCCLRFALDARVDSQNHIPFLNERFLG